MSDDEDNIPPVKRLKGVHYGNLEDREKARLSGANEGAIAYGKEYGHINISDGKHFDLEASESVMQAEAMAEFEKRKRARTIQVSTDDSEVKANFRQLGEPICLFGEGPAERRDRLRKLLAEIGEDSIQRKKVERQQEQKKKDEGPVIPLSTNMHGDYENYRTEELSHQRSMMASSVVSTTTTQSTASAHHVSQSPSVVRRRAPRTPNRNSRQFLSPSSPSSSTNIGPVIPRQILSSNSKMRFRANNGRRNGDNSTSEDDDNDDDLDEMLLNDARQRSLNPPPTLDVNDYFTRMIAELLKKISNEQQINARRLIHATITEAQLGNLTMEYTLVRYRTTAAATDDILLNAARQRLLNPPPQTQALDVNDYFTRMIAELLKKIPNEQQIYARRIIHATITEAQLGNLTIEYKLNRYRTTAAEVEGRTHK